MSCWARAIARAQQLICWAGASHINPLVGLLALRVDLIHSLDSKSRSISSNNIKSKKIRTFAGLLILKGVQNEETCEELLKERF